MSSTGNNEKYTASNNLSQQFVKHLSECIKIYKDNPQDNTVENELRVMRSQVARAWENSDPGMLKMLHAGTPGNAQRLLLASNLHDAPVSEKDRNYSSKLCQQINNNGSGPDTIKYLIALTLYIPAENAPGEIFNIAIPSWYISDFTAYLLRPKIYFSARGDVDTYCRFMVKAVNFFHSRVYKSNNGRMPESGSAELDLAALFTRHIYTIPLYFGYTDLKDIMIKRAQIADAALIESEGHTNYTFTRHTGSSSRLRLGVLCAHYIPQTETYATLPVYEHLDRSKYEVFLYGANLRGHVLENYCKDRADKLVELPKNINKQLQTIRNDNLDILFIGSNITAVNSAISQLATYRMAPVQVTSICSPVTTGMRNVDYYIAGDLTVSAQQDQDHYTEKLVTIDGSGLCFSYPEESPTPSIKPDRNQMGISDGTVLYVSGANYFKIIPELRETWTKIIAEVPDSLLVLYPFNPYWSRSYQAGPLILHLQKLFDGYGIDRERLVILKPFPTRTDIKALLDICDVYLDAFPYGGATSIIDPLQTSLPTIVMDGDYLRFRQASAILRELQIPELITADEDSYIELAVRLGRNRELRKKLRKEITSKMRNGPAFLDSRKYSENIGKLLEDLHKVSSKTLNTKL